MNDILKKIKSMKAGLALVDFRSFVTIIAYAFFYSFYFGRPGQPYLPY